MSRLLENKQSTLCTTQHMNVKILNKNLSLLILFLIIFFLDRISKFLVLDKVNRIGENKIFSSTFINFELIWNKGIAFGLLSFSSEFIYNFVSLIIVFVILLIIFFIFKAKNYEKFFFTMILGGAIGNLYDRIIYKSVPDFIDLHINNFHWFIFNIADIFITLGVLSLICSEILIKKND